MDNFSFVIPDLLAGMACPERGEAFEEDLHFLKSRGIGAMVNLTERTSQHWKSCLKQNGFHYLHLPIEDFAVPTLDQVQKFVDFVDAMNSQKIGVVAHCQAGMGRTGTMLACYLVRTGKAADESILRIRKSRPGSIETPEQEELVHLYSERPGDPPF